MNCYTRSHSLGSSPTCLPLPVFPWAKPQFYSRAASSSLENAEFLRYCIRGGQGGRVGVAEEAKDDANGRMDGDESDRKPRKPRTLQQLKHSPPHRVIVAERTKRRSFSCTSCIPSIVNNKPFRLLCTVLSFRPPSSGPTSSPVAIDQLRPCLSFGACGGHTCKNNALDEGGWLLLLFSVCRISP